ncbi:MAG TPA: DUF2946 domain-containing protein [Gammaproteobacteria bacterium]|nr:DUF2946 domain-containing protein [Gammaproteobacteria bacterium]|tara:strand:- start:718 stop:1317 length:600 start_codon:yes stop_codon:yes gene_type:complete
MQKRFDNRVIRALEKWPDVPACYGWLRLDRRGNWLIKGQSVSHRRAIDFLGRNYSSDENGNWFVQNGPQRAYCNLDYTPWIYHLDGLDQLFTHTQNHIKEMRGLIVDDNGDILIETEYGIGLLEDRDLVKFIEILESPPEDTATNDFLVDRLANLDPKLHSSIELLWHGRSIKAQAMYGADVPKAFGYVATPLRAPVKD